MTESEQIEEILIEAASYGLRLEVIETASKVVDSNSNIKPIDAYQKAFNEWVK
jgi:hypothetical protein